MHQVWGRNATCFLSELQKYLAGKGTKPSYEVELCFGEEYPDPKVPKNRKLIVVQVGESERILEKTEGWRTFSRSGCERPPLTLDVV